MGLLANVFSNDLNEKINYSRNFENKRSNCSYRVIQDKLQTDKHITYRQRYGKQTQKVTNKQFVAENFEEENCK